MERFFQKIDKTDSCWIWTASTRNGYGAFKLDGKVCSAHRLSYEMHKGDIPEGLFVMHDCDNKLCVNPAHLTVGTHSQNMSDAAERGLVTVPEGKRFEKGRISNRRIYDTDLISRLKREIEKHRGSYGYLKKIAKRFPVAYHTVKDIAAGRSYAEVQPA